MTDNEEFNFVVADSGAKKHAEGKQRVDLVTSEMIEGLAEVLTYGSYKYNDRNWEKGLKHSVHYGAAMRHLLKFWKGINLDDESNLHHIAHAMCNLGMLLTNIKRQRFDLDDRVQENTEDNDYQDSHTFPNFTEDEVELMLEEYEMDKESKELFSVWDREEKGYHVKVCDCVSCESVRRYNKGGVFK